MQRVSKDAAAGALFLVIGAGFALYAWASLPLGTSFRMGPGFFPLLVAVLLALFGMGILVTGLRTPSEAGHPAPWRAVILLSLALVGFGLMVRPLGLAPVLFLSSLAASFASTRMTFARAAATAAGLTVICVILFGFVLDLSLPMLGDWFY